MTASDGDNDGEGERSTVLGIVRELVVLVVTALVIAVVVKSFVAQAFYIPSGSMLPQLQIDDRVVVSKVAYRLHDPHRGDIVVFDGTDTFGRLGNGTGETDYVKRVIGLPGDHVVCCDARGRITVNGQPLREKSYLHPRRRPVRPAVRHRGAGGRAGCG